MGSYEEQLRDLAENGNLRSLPEVEHHGKWVIKDGVRMLNLSSNDYLGLAGRRELQEEFLEANRDNYLPFSSSSSRLLTGNFTIYSELERKIAQSFEREAALIFNSGYHANTGILPALTDKRTLLLADKLVHASIIDGILLSDAQFQRFKHNDYDQLERLVAKNMALYDTIIIITESIFSMDGDIADLDRLVDIKHRYDNIMLYVDEAHAIGVRGSTGMGVAEERGVINEIDLLVGTFGKALASMGAYLVCSSAIREYLVNKMRPLIFSTALPPFQIAWSSFIWEKLPSFTKERDELAKFSSLLSKALAGRGGEISQSHIIPFIVGESADCILKAEELRRKGFYCLPVRPPTVPKGTSRIRFSLMSSMTIDEVEQLAKVCQSV